MTTDRKRLEALLVDEATGTLTAAERAELERLAAAHEEVDRYAFERAAAAVFLAAAGGVEPLPAGLGAKLAAAAARMLDGSD